MFYSDPTIIEPSGAPRPLLKHTETVSKSLHISAGLIPRYAAALRHLAPSRCIFILNFLASFLAYLI
jgi:hypothetical protein